MLIRCYGHALKTIENELYVNNNNNSSKCLIQVRFVKLTLDSGKLVYIIVRQCEY